MEDGRILKSRLRASSMYNTYYGPYSARLQARNYGSTRGGWIARLRNTHQWIQVDLEKVATLKGVATQGRYDATQYVRSYTITYSTNGRRFVPYREGRTIRVSLFRMLPRQTLTFRAFVGQREDNIIRRICHYPGAKCLLVGIAE